MNRFLRLLGKSLAALLIIFTSCKEGEEVFDAIVDAEQRGAILRTVNLISNELPIGVSDARFAVELEEQDQQNGDLLSSVEVFVGFNDNTVPDGGTDLDVAESLFATITAGEFTTGEFGLPRTTVDIPLTEMLSFTGVQESDLFGGDNFSIRFELVLTDGRRFSNDDNSGTITGSYFSSPFLYTPTVVCPVDAELFVGAYDLVSVVPGLFGDPVFVEGTVELSVGETSTQRVFSAVYLVDIGQGPREFSFDFVCGNVIPGPDQASGLGCAGGDGLAIGPPEEGVDPGNYDFVTLDDSTFNIVLTDNVRSDCGGGPVVAEVRLTKQ